MLAVRERTDLLNDYEEISGFYGYSDPELYQAIQIGLDQIKDGEIITEEEMMKSLNKYIGK
jgi:hypothetical protein